MVYGYFPKPQGAGFELERFDFMKPKKGSKQESWFRPADVMVGTDGAIYVADWYDPGVGGHRMQDKGANGTIYRIAPKGFKPVNPKLDLDTTFGQIDALKSPACNVRYLGYRRLQARIGANFLSVANKVWREGDNPYVKSRALWLLAQDDNAKKIVGEVLSDSKDAQERILAFRALRRAGEDLPRVGKEGGLRRITSSAPRGDARPAGCFTVGEEGALARPVR